MVLFISVTDNNPPGLVSEIIVPFGNSVINIIHKINFNNSIGTNDINL